MVYVLPLTGVAEQFDAYAGVCITKLEANKKKLPKSITFDLFLLELLIRVFTSF
ncbi:hypothetical Protein YC6258_03530 [Gynuella sunshinyii YC6258]|uniref:Uncharacterized protein n=1 Tax=Gynuella sunshinyii YC6258 TaxID=1445510 RepID=A0A0C5VMM4_9GAMM|nr:hypothetical Protein YC6258_03530 [Gynuella sunshinyii YC6258]